MRKAVFIIFIFSSFFSLKAQTQPEVELPSFVITGLRSYDYPVRTKINPDFYSILSDEFLKPRLADSVYKLSKDFDPKVAGEILRDTSDFVTGYASGTFGMLQQPSLKAFVSVPFKDMVVYARGDFEQNREFVKYADETNFGLGAGFRYFAYNDSLLDPGTEYFGNFSMKQSLYNFYASDDSGKNGSNNYFNTELGFRNLTNRYTQYGAKFGGLVFAPLTGNFYEGLISLNGFFNTYYDFVEIFTNISVRNQNLTNVSGIQRNNQFMNLSGVGGFVVGRTMKLLGGIDLATTPNDVFISPSVKFSMRFANGLFLIASYNPSTTFLYNQDLVNMNRYFVVSDGPMYAVLRKQHEINATAKYEYEKLIEFEAGASWFASNSYPYFSEHPQRGMYGLSYADAKGLQGFVSVTIHPGIFGRFFGELKFNSVQDDSSKNIPYVPSLEASVAYGNNFNRVISYDVKLSYISSVWADIANTREVSGGFTLGLNVEYSLIHNVKLFARVDDLLNTKIVKWGRYEPAGLNAAVGASFIW
ncbi:MAG: hypothetical protein LC102_09650 [Ignavibacteriales bacterium]|nr:MAG: hypothetical protein F9K26_01280 [Ignavibacteriaceae bacterium]MBW7872042.1 hypothetical protein [Ignavibacteria bacterium]MCZ2143677.1 hypothetical protein [Ignavibacteriales bacterium]OQY77213.1 MAG: hypothetical protein B6D45_03015 [Ignavibacteriales bacterium UTCHB3]MBV6446061.1 hypothetical protein [Ignavibacteriaceae bacterium]